MKLMKSKWRLIPITVMILVAISCQSPDKNSDKIAGEQEIQEEDNQVTGNDLYLDINHVDGFIESLPDAPENILLGEYYASDDTEYAFCEGGILKVSHSWQSYMIGTWELSDDTVFMRLSKKFEMRGIGEPLPPPPAIPGNYIDKYKEYEIIETAISDSMILVWQKIKRIIKEAPDYPYQILDTNLLCTEEWLYSFR